MCINGAYARPRNLSSMSCQSLHTFKPWVLTPFKIQKTVWCWMYMKWILPLSEHVYFFCFTDNQPPVFKQVGTTIGYDSFAAFNYSLPNVIDNTGIKSLTCIISDTNMHFGDPVTSDFSVTCTAEDYNNNTATKVDQIKVKGKKILYKICVQLKLITITKTCLL